VSDDRPDRDWGDDDRRRQPDDDYRPPRRQYEDERDDYDEEYGHADPRQKVVAAGIALMLVGILGILASLAMAIIGLVMVFSGANKAGPQAANEIVTGSMLLVGGAFSMAGCGVVAFGGARMRQCRSYGLAMAAAIIAIASIAIFGLCSVLIMPFGIWALVVLSNSEVKREFRRTPKERDQDAEDYSD
jgi:hypothetical protein